MEESSQSLEYSSEQIGKIVERALNVADFDANPTESLDGEADEDMNSENIENDRAEAKNITLSQDCARNPEQTGKIKEGAGHIYCGLQSDITPDVISAVEERLDLYEKIALVFLIYDSEDLALQRIKVAKQSSNINLISDWARMESSSNTNTHWQDKFLEALAIIQNYKLIAELGFSREEVDCRFFPRNVQTSVYVQITRKILYAVCESLDFAQTERLLQFLKKELINCGRAPKDFWAFDPALMEIALLQMMSLRFLNIGVNCSNTDVSGLCRGLKAIGASELAESLEEFQSIYTGNTEASPASEITDLRNSITGHSVVKSEEFVVSPVYEENFVYHIDPKNVGLCVIVNQKIFTRETNPKLQNLLPKENLETRIGTDLDRDRLVEIFTKHGFEIETHENLKHTELVGLVTKCATDLMKDYHSCFALCILSHGQKNAVYGTNSIHVSVEEIENMLHGSKCPNLLGKPKILIIQACQGTTRQKAVQYENTVMDGPVYTKTAPEVGDMVTFWSTVPGYAAFRDKLHGSWFITSLWNEIMKENNSNRDLIKIFTRVSGKVSDRHTGLGNELNAMMPVYNSSLRRDLILPLQPEFCYNSARILIERIMFYKLVYEFAENYMKRKGTYD